MTSARKPYTKSATYSQRRQESLARLASLPSVKCEHCGGYFRPGSGITQHQKACGFECSYPGCGATDHKGASFCGVHHPVYKKMLQYGLTIYDYFTMFEAQYGKCATCDLDGMPHGLGRDKSIKSRVLHVDHDHATGKIRQLLCHSCNIALGMAKDDPTRLRRLANYVEQWRNNNE